MNIERRNRKAEVGTISVRAEIEKLPISFGTL
jgi:hypothetical protein